MSGCPTGSGQIRCYRVRPSGWWGLPVFAVDAFLQAAFGAVFGAHSAEKAFEAFWLFCGVGELLHSLHQLDR